MDNKKKQTDNSIETQAKNIDAIKREVMESLLEFKVSRNKIGLTVAELAEKSGVSVGVISELENNDKRENKDKKVPSLVNFIALTRALGMSEEFVLSTVLKHESRNGRTSKDKRMVVENSLREYGIQDDDSLSFLMRSVSFVKQRVKNKKLDK